MDFARDDAQTALAELAGTILADHAGHERLRAIERSESRFDDELWRRLAAADLLGVPIAERLGGAGLGFVEHAIIAEAYGWHLAHVPLMPTTLATSMLERFGDGRFDDLVRRIVAGETIVTVGFCEEATIDPVPTTQAARVGDDWVLSGRKIKVPYAHIADAVVVIASTQDGPRLFVLDLTEPPSVGLTVTRAECSCGEPQSVIELAGVHLAGDALVTADDAAAVAWTVDRWKGLLCAAAAGVAEAALALTTSYVCERRQFDQPIGAFQAVHQRIADAQITTTAISLTTQQLVWRLSENVPVDDELPIAAYWASKAYGVCRAAVHLHGGVGVDLDYPLHRYYLWSRELQLLLGGGAGMLSRYGDRLAGDRAASATSPRC